MQPVAQCRKLNACHCPQKAEKHISMDFAVPVNQCRTEKVKNEKLDKSHDHDREC